MDVMNILIQPPQSTPLRNLHYRRKLRA